MVSFYIKKWEKLCCIDKKGKRRQQEKRGIGMHDLYVEQIVKARKDNRTGGLQKACMVLTVFLAAVTLLLDVRCIVLLVIAAIATWYLGNNQNVEYEYLFVNGQLDIDVVKTRKRKKLGSFQMEELECMACKDSVRLDGYKRQSMKQIHAMTGSTGFQPYALIFKQNQNLVEVIIEPEEELLKIFQTLTPNKILR